MNNKIIFLISSDLIASFFALYCSFFIRFEFFIPETYFSVFIFWAPIFSVLQSLIFYGLKLYNRYYRYTSIDDVFTILRATLINSGILTSIIFFISKTESFPRSVLILYTFFTFALTVCIRFSVRIYYLYYHNQVFKESKSQIKKILIVGAGKSGEKIAREISNHLRNIYEIVGFIDDDPDKKGVFIHGVEVLSDISGVSNLKNDYDEVIITIPFKIGTKVRELIKICNQTGKSYKIIKGLNGILTGNISIKNVRNISYLDLLGRERVDLNMNLIKNVISGKRILITGAGGSIGSELVKQCLLFSPAEIICLDQSEESIFKINQQYNGGTSDTIIKTILASITEKKIINNVFFENQPHIVFHAAAYKHVPIQELHPWNTVNTNVKGTLNLVELSDFYKVKKFVLVSTDKAVNPVSVMGATKRISEKLIESFNDISKTSYMAVRFGNVLGSSGSAIPIFQNQINRGGPITITHPEMTRYFMLVQEACQLILQCGALGIGGEIFLLKMGRSIKILDMAKDMIRLSGLEPEEDIPIVYTGLRPGEKLYEELQFSNEIRINTNHKKILILKSHHKSKPWNVLNEKISELLQITKSLDHDKILLKLKDVLPNYNPRILTKSELNIDQFYSLKGKA